MEERSNVCHGQLTRRHSVDSNNYISAERMISEPEQQAHSTLKKKAERSTSSLGTPTTTLDQSADTKDNNIPASPQTSPITSAKTIPKELRVLGEQIGTDTTTNSIILEIVQHIASYLSLSDVGSIANLYSSFANMSGDSDDIGCSLTPIIQHDRTAWTARGECDIKAPQITTPLQQRSHSTSNTSCHGTIQPLLSMTRMRLDQVQSVIKVKDHNNMVSNNDDMAMSTIVLEGAKERDSLSLGSGPDECAGLGLHVSQPKKNCSTTADATIFNESKNLEKEIAPFREAQPIRYKTPLSQLFSSTFHNEMNTKLENSVTKKYDTKACRVEACANSNINHSPTMSTPPGLVSLSPVAPNNEPYDYYHNDSDEVEFLVRDGIDDNEEHSTESEQYFCRSTSSKEGDKNNNHIHTNDKVFQNQAETIRLEHIQQRLRKVVLTHPHSIRSYSQSCSMRQTHNESHSTKQQYQPKKWGLRQRIDHWSWKRNKEKSSPAQPLLSSICTCCHLLLKSGGRYLDEGEDVLFGQGEKSPAVLSVSEDEDGDIVTEKDIEEEIDDYVNHLAACCSCSKEQRRNHLSQLQQHTLPPPPHIRILRLFTDPIFQNIPLSIIFDASSSSLHTLLKTFESGFAIASTSIRFIIKVLVYSIHASCSNLALTLHPKRLLEFLMHLHQRAMRTRNGGGFVSHAFSSVTNSVVGSYLGTTAMMKSFYSNSGGRGCSSNVDGSSRVSDEGLDSNDVCRRFNNDIISESDVSERVISEKMFRKINKVDSIAKVISYIEQQDDALPLHEERRVKRMMHYPVSLRPFVATIEIVTTPVQKIPFRNIVSPVPSCHQIKRVAQHQYHDSDSDYQQEDSDDSSCIHDSSSVSNYVPTVMGNDGANGIITTSPFMCTPKSFPPTPGSRAYVLATGTKFAEDVIFLARDQLRVEKGLESSNDKTRAMAKALLKGSRLAIFNAVDMSGGITLTCGQHCASKVGNDLYCSARGMIPILRNCFVYFEMSVSTPPPLIMTLHHASLSVGLSTLGMPLNVLVGAWKGSAGLCSTGQILTGSQWCSPLEPRTYGSSSVVGCLVYLDDESAIETPDGVMVPAHVVFNINGQVLTPKGVPCNGGCEDGSRVGNTDIHNQGDDLCLTSSIPLLVPSGEELFPTLTLHSSQTEVTCRFCSEDLVAKSKEEIGVPTDVTVYAVDGSVVFNEEETCNDFVI